MTTPLRKRAIKAYTKSYPDPIHLNQGDKVQITKHDLWEGQYTWLWCIHPSGKEGWVPEAFLEVTPDGGTALRDYHAIEISIDEGEDVLIFEEESGWYWAENSKGERGWVPISCL